MKTAYEVIIDGNTVKWIGDHPPVDGPMRATLVLESAPKGVSGAELNRIIDAAIAKHGYITSIEDPVAWQREQRIDRPLPGRE